ncbi:MAG TPA: orotate phosphoribosyltransferase [Candidatus Binataceae bacterium]
METKPSRDELLKLLARESYVEREVTLSSGQTANFYIDCRRTLYIPRGAFLVGELMLELIRPAGIELIGGLAAAALPVTDAIIGAAYRHKVDLAGFFVRKETKQHGLQQRIEGVFRLGKITAVVDDTITTGGSSLEAVSALREAGAVVEAAFGVVDRGAGASEAFARAGLNYTYLFTSDEVVAAAESRARTV